MELMSPSGNLKSFIAAIEGGADSVYLGYLKFNARRPADNFDAVMLEKAVKFAHEKDRKVYLTLNIDLKSNELPEALKVVELAVRTGVDALIVKDYGLIDILRRLYKGKIEYHASTQTAITSSEGAKFAEKIGFSRIVLARELSVSEIKAVTEKISISTEVFVEGSMCFSVSGRCLMSSWVGGRSGNRGGCTAPCRLQWECKDKKYPFFSMKDMLLVSNLKNIEESGVDSLKIEGRLKSYSWVYTITKIYREALEVMGDDAKIKEFREHLAKFSARETDTGHFFKHNELVGRNEEWDSYKKGIEITLETDTALFSVNKKIGLTIVDGKIKVNIEAENLTCEMEFAVPAAAKKGKSTELSSVKDIIGETVEKGTVLEIDPAITESVLQCSSTQLSKIAEGIDSKLKLLIKQLNELPGLSEAVKSEVEYSHKEIKRARVIGDSPDKVIIDHLQLGFFAEHDKFKFIDTVTAEVFPDVNISLLKKTAMRYKLIVSLPHVIYEKDLDGYRNLLKQLEAEGLDNFEANSFTGISLLENVKGHKYAGAGIPVYNHKAGAFLYDMGFSSVYGAYEAESDVLKTLSLTLDGSFEVLVYSKLALFISRVEDQSFNHGAVFKDRIGTEIECKKYGGMNHFISSKQFNLVSDKVKKTGITADSLTADIRHNAHLTELLRLLDKRIFKEGEFSFFNFFGKLV